jgi:hypothetical protein
MDSSRLEQRVTVGLRVFAATALALAGFHSGNNPDTLGHLAQGRQIAELGHIPSTDTWSLLHAGRPWLNYEWLSDLLYYALYAGVGYDGLIALKCALLGSAGWMLTGLAGRLGGSRAAALGALALVAAIPAMRFRLSDRPHVFGMFLAAVYVTVLAGLVSAPAEPSTRARAYRVGLLAVLHVLWVNLHGSHLLGVLITAAFAVFAPREARRPLLALLGLEALASCISPWGPRILTDALGHVFDPRYRELVSEWRAWAADNPPWLLVYPLGSSLVLTLLGPRLFRGGPATRAGLTVVLVLGIECFRSIRFVGECVLIGAPWIGVGLAPLLERRSSRGFSGTVVGAAAVLAAFAVWKSNQLPPFLGFGHGLIYSDLPRGPGVLLARAARPPRVFAAMHQSWPLMWEAPHARFVIDGRVPFYGPEHVNAIGVAFGDTAVFDAIARRADLNAVVLKHTLRSEQKLLAHLSARPGWNLVLIDDDYALYVRNDLATASGYRTLSTLEPSYQPRWIFAATTARRAAIARELATLADVPTARSFVNFVRAGLDLAPFARDGGHSGLRMPADAADWSVFRRAEARLRALSPDAHDLAAVAALHAVVLATLCEPERAEEVLARSAEFHLEPSRETTLAGQEIAIRRGERAAVRQLVDAGLRMPEGRGDTWLLALRDATEHPPACPP